MSETCLIGIGANLNHPKTQCQLAIEKLKAIPEIRILKISSPVQNPPIPGSSKNSPDYVNAVVQIQTSLQPQDLLARLLTLETQMGRTRNQKWEPRVIDLDLLTYGDCLLETNDLRLPHPEMHQRAFVLGPIAEIDANWRHPTLNKTAQELLRGLKLHPLEKLTWD